MSALKPISLSGPPNMVELRSSGGAGKERGYCLGVFQLLPGGVKGGSQGPVYRQLHDGNWQFYLYRWDIDCIHCSALHAANKYFVTPLQLSAN